MSAEASSWVVSGVTIHGTGGGAGGGGGFETATAAWDDALWDARCVLAGAFSCVGEIDCGSCSRISGFVFGGDTKGNAPSFTSMKTSSSTIATDSAKDVARLPNEAWFR